MNEELKPCPFCGRAVDRDLSDTLYPNGTYWIDEPRGRHYHSRKNRTRHSQPCWTMHCTECNGGCGAEISADTEEEVRAKWNCRASPALIGLPVIDPDLLDTSKEAGK